jgi:hypothetical protein
MRYIIFLFFFMIPGIHFAQEGVTTLKMPMDPDGQKIMYREVIEQEGSRDVLYNRAAEWLRSYYVNPASVVKILDKVNGKIEGTGRFDIYFNDKDGNRITAGQIMYDFKLEFKDDKMRYTATDFNLKSASRFPVEKWLNRNDPAYNSNWDSYLYQIDTTMQRFGTSLREGLKPEVIKKDEW